MIIDYRIPEEDLIPINKNTIFGKDKAAIILANKYFYLRDNHRLYHRKFKQLGINNKIDNLYKFIKMYEKLRINLKH